MNKVYLIGRITKDLELKHTNNNISYCRFTIAVNREYAKDNEQKTDFINCIVWRTQADNLCKYQHKGSQIALEGSLQVTSYDDNNGVKKVSTEVAVNHVEFLSSAKKEETAPVTNNFNNTGKSQRQQEFENAFKPRNDISADDLPF